MRAFHQNDRQLHDATKCHTVLLLSEDEKIRRIKHTRKEGKGANCDGESEISEGNDEEKMQDRKSRQQSL